MAKGWSSLKADLPMDDRSIYRTDKISVDEEDPTFLTEKTSASGSTSMEKHDCLAGYQELSGAEDLVRTDAGGHSDTTLPTLQHTIEFQATISSYDSCRTSSLPSGRIVDVGNQANLDTDYDFDPIPLFTSWMEDLSLFDGFSIDQNMLRGFDETLLHSTKQADEDDDTPESSHALQLFAPYGDAE